MSIQCPACSHALSSEGGLPKFCSNCGEPLDPTIAGTHPGKTPTMAGTQGTTADPNTLETMPHGVNIPMGSTAQAHNPTPVEKVKPGDKIGPFNIVRKLGQGGMGSVFEATHDVTGQRVALKLLARSLRTTDETVQRFQRESQIAASINHPRSTFVYQAGQHDGQFYITMELMPGGTLADIVKTEGGMPIERAVDYVLDMISGLQAAHEAGIVHRDLKPSNCFVDSDDRVKIGDFGLAKSFVGDSSLTQTGIFMGTPQFAAPEQLRSSDIDERADIYAIGGTLFYLLSGRAPFTGNAAQVIASIASEPAPKIDTVVKDVPRELNRLIQLTLEKDPARRPENLESVRLALLPFSSRGTAKVDPGRRIAAFFIDVMAVFMCIMVFSQFVGAFAPLIKMSYTSFSFFMSIGVLIISASYFAIQEKLFGWTIGKWLMKIRVIDQFNHSPGWINAYVRALIHPGLSYFLGQFIAYVMGFDPSSIETEADIRMLLEFQLFAYLSWIPIFLCFIKARESNGYLGFHEWITGTRVVRLAGALEYRRPSGVPVTLPNSFDSENEVESVGDYRCLGSIGFKSDLKTPVLMGHDKSLDRVVWMSQSEPATETRKAVSRPTRLRVLSEHLEQNQNWTITESIKGMPLAEFVVDKTTLEWRSFRPLLREMVYELAKGQDDGTIPKKLDLNNVWIDSSGRARVLDEPIYPVKHAGLEPRLLDPIQLVHKTLDLFIENQVAPVHVLEFRNEIRLSKGDPDSLREIGQRLGELADLPSAWGWHDRFGVFAISSSLELGLGASLIWVLTLIGGFYMSVEPTKLAFITLGILSTFVILIGGFMRGGIAFRMTGISIRKNKTLEQASWLRCAFRNWIAWIIQIVVGVVSARLVFELIKVVSADSFIVEEFNAVAVFSILGLPVLFAFLVIVSAYAIWRPSRGLQDVLAGTRLVRK